MEEEEETYCDDCGEVTHFLNRDGLCDECSDQRAMDDEAQEEYHDGADYAHEVKSLVNDRGEDFARGFIQNFTL